MSPKRIQRKRTAGWKLPPNTVTVTRPGYWGNPYAVGMTAGEVLAKDSAMWHWGGLRDLPDGHKLTAQECVAAYEKWIHCKVGESGWTLAYEAAARLRGKDLVCWCPLESACHGDVLLEIANGSEVES